MPLNTTEKCAKAISEGFGERPERSPTVNNDSCSETCPNEHNIRDICQTPPATVRDNHAEGMVQKMRFLIDKTLKPLCSSLNLTQLRTHDHQNLNLTPPSGEKKFWPKSIFLVFSNLFDPKLTRNGLQCR